MLSRSTTFPGANVHVCDVDGDLEVRSADTLQTVVTVKGTKAQIDAVDLNYDFASGTVTVDGSACPTQPAGLWARICSLFGSNEVVASQHVVTNVSRGGAHAFTDAPDTAPRQLRMSVSGSRTGLKVTVLVPHGVNVTARNVNGSDLS